jgi:hypothetical protein
MPSIEYPRANPGIAALSVAAIAMLTCQSPPAQAASAPAVLGEAPVCEPSGLVRAPWDPRLFVVADDDQAGALYGYVLEHGSFRGQSVLDMPAGNRPRDIEALATVEDDLLVAGSYSRSSSCQPKSKRRRMRILSWNGEKLESTRAFGTSDAEWAHITRSVEGCQAALLTKPEIAGGRAFCEALVAGENAATAGSCTALNIEGAAAVTAESSGERSRVWLGLRSPLVEGRAALIRLTPGLDEFKLDRIRLIDLGGRGIRSLTHDVHQLWGIAGPTQDADEPFLLWSLDAARLATNDALIPVIHWSNLPTSAEGILIDGGVARGVVDGRKPENEDASPPQKCRKPAGQFHLPVDPSD